VKLISSLTNPGGTYNEDAFGYIEQNGEITAAWVLDGVTGINPRNILPARTDAIWIVARVQEHLHRLAATDLPLEGLLHELVTLIIADWHDVSRGVAVPPDYDLPACCLLMVKHTPTGWEALRLGDSFLLSEGVALKNHEAPPSNLTDLEGHLKTEARKRRDAGEYDMQTLLAEFRPLMQANRKTRNQPGSYSVLEPTEASLFMPQFMSLGHSSSLLLCTDGFYRSVDYYDMHDDVGLMAACRSQQGAEDMVQVMRRLEGADAECERYLRFKPRDDATVVMLG
jgi:hypothetical protein